MCVCVREGGIRDKEREGEGREKQSVRGRKECNEKEKSNNSLSG